MPLSQPPRKIDISIDAAFRRELSRRRLLTVVDRALEVALPPNQTGQLSLSVTDDATVQELNREFRGMDESTDVLSFSPSYPGHWEGGGEAPRHPPGSPLGTEDDVPFVLPPDQLPIIGDVVISYPQALRQAQAHNQDVDGEVALLIVHGVLHLVGYDHVEPEDAGLMQAKEQAALAAPSS